MSVLLQAAAIMGQRGKAVEAFVEGDPETGPVCALGALNLATGHDAEDMAYYEAMNEMKALYQAICEIGGYQGSDVNPDDLTELSLLKSEMFEAITNYSDEHTLDEVLTLFEKADAYVKEPVGV